MTALYFVQSKLADPSHYKIYRIYRVLSVKSENLSMKSEKLMSTPRGIY